MRTMEKELYDQLKVFKKGGTQDLIEKGIALLEKAARKGIRTWETNELIGILAMLDASYMIAGNYHAAQNAMKRCLKIGGENLFVCARLCTIALQAKKVKAANYWLKKALKYRDEDPEYADKLVEGVEKLKKRN